MNECDACMKGKMTRTPFKNKINYNTQQPMDINVADTMGPIKPTSLSGFRYAFVIVDIHTRLPYIYLLRDKTEAAQVLIDHITMMQTQFNTLLKLFHSDGGTEIVNSDVIEFLKRNGTIRTNTTPNTPQNNAVAETMFRTLMNMAKCMMYHSNVSKKLWDEAIMYAAHVVRRSTTKHDDKDTPIKSLTKQKPSIKHIHTFGCDAFYHIHKDNREGKLDQNARKGIFVGVAGGNETYFRIYDVELNKIITSRDVRFNENMFTQAKQMVNEGK